MFVWMSSHGGRPRIGCCGGLFILPLAWMLLFGGFGRRGGWWLLVLAILALGAMFLLPRLMAASDNAGKRKNDEYADKPKRDERYILSDDGEIIDASEEDADQSAGGDRFD